MARMNRHLAFAALLLLALAALPSVVSADQNYSVPFDPTVYNVHYNQSYMIAPGGSTPIIEWGILILIAFVLLISSVYASTKPEMMDIDILLGLMAMLPMGIAAWTSTAIDIVTGYGVTSSCTDLSYMENHTLYHFDWIGVVLWVFTAIALINVIRMIVMHRRIEQLMGNQK